MSMKGMKKSGISGMALILATGMLAGCGVVYPELTSEDHDHVVEYAAGLLMKYDKNNTHKLVLPEAEETEEEPAAEAEAPTTAEAPATGSNPENSAVSADTSTPPEPAETVVQRPLTEILAVTGLDFQYAGYEVVEEYPTAVTPGEIYFVVNATEGNKLLVLKFDVTNNSGADYLLNMGERNVRFKIGWNGETPRNALLTMLLNDLSTYAGNIPAGETVQLVAVCDLPGGSAETVEPLEFQVKDDADTYSVSLQ